MKVSLAGVELNKVFLIIGTLIFAALILLNNEVPYSDSARMVLRSQVLLDSLGTRGCFGLLDEIYFQRGFRSDLTEVMFFPFLWLMSGTVLMAKKVCLLTSFIFTGFGVFTICSKLFSTENKWTMFFVIMLNHYILMTITKLIPESFFLPVSLLFIASFIDRVSFNPASCFFLSMAMCSRPVEASFCLIVPFIYFGHSTYKVKSVTVLIALLTAGLWFLPAFGNLAHWISYNFNLAPEVYGFTFLQMVSRSVLTMLVPSAWILFIVNSLISYKENKKASRHLIIVICINLILSLVIWCLPNKTLRFYALLSLAFEMFLFSDVVNRKRLIHGYILLKLLIAPTLLWLPFFPPRQFFYGKGTLYLSDSSSEFLALLKNRWPHVTNWTSVSLSPSGQQIPFVNDRLRLQLLSNENKDGLKFSRAESNDVKNPWQFFSKIKDKDAVIIGPIGGIKTYQYNTDGMWAEKIIEAVQTGNIPPTYKAETLRFHFQKQNMEYLILSKLIGQ